MPYTVSTPRRFDFDNRLFGLTLKQWAYMGAGMALAVPVAFGVGMPNANLLVRVALALVIMAPAAAMAYVRIRGLPLDKALVAFIRYRFGPRQRVWRKGFGEYLVREGVAVCEAPVVAVDRRAIRATVYVLVNATVITMLVLATAYFERDGLREVIDWLS